MVSVAWRAPVERTGTMPLVGGRALPPARTHQVLKGLALDGFAPQTPCGEARHHCAVWTPQSRRVRVAQEVEAVAFRQIECSWCLYHFSAYVTRGPSDQRLVLRTMPNGCAPKHTRP